MKFKLSDVNKLLRQLNLDPQKLPFDKKQILRGLEVELEHGRVDARTNVSNDNLIITGKIALAHLFEYPDYYTRLDKMEKEAEKHWKNKKKKQSVKKK